MKLLKPKICNGEKSESIAEEHEGNQKVPYKSSCDESCFKTQFQIIIFENGFLLIFCSHLPCAYLCLII